MTFERLVQIGRVVYLATGKYEGKLAMIVEVIDGNRALVDGPCSGVHRHPCSFKHMHLTKIVLTIRHASSASTVKKAWESAKVSEQWQQTTWAKKLKLRELRENLNDYDRFKLMKAKQARNRIIRNEVAKLRRENKKNPPKETKKPVAKKAAKPAAAKAVAPAKTAAVKAKK